jgi:hypothetical protein
MPASEGVRLRTSSVTLVQCSFCQCRQKRANVTCIGHQLQLRDICRPPSHHLQPKPDPRDICVNKARHSIITVRSIHRPPQKYVRHDLRDVENICGPSEPKLITVHILVLISSSSARLQRRTRRPSSAKPKTPLARREKEKKRKETTQKVSSHS